VRQIIKKVIVKNFRLFDEIPRIFEFGGGFSQVIAGNSKGKTSLWWALKIGLTGNIPRDIGRLTEKGIIYYPQIDDPKKAKEIQGKTKAEISIILNNEPINGVRPFLLLDSEEDEIVIHTIVPPTGRIKYYVNGNPKWDKIPLRRILNDLSINPNDPFQFLEQEKTTNLLEKGPIGLMDALEETLDIKEIREKLDDSLSSYQESKKAYQDIKSSLNKLQETIDILKVEYEKLKNYDTLNSEIKNLKEEIISRRYRDTYDEILKIESEIEEFTTTINDLTENNKRNSTKIEILQCFLERKINLKNTLSNRKDLLNKNLGKFEEKKDLYPSLFRAIETKLNKIEELKKIDKNKLITSLDKLDKKILEMHSEINQKTGRLKELETGKKALKKGISIGPKSSEDFLKILKENGITAELIINTISLKGSIVNENQIELVQLFESILNSYRWGVVVFGSPQIFQKSIELAKLNFFNNFLINIQNDSNNNSFYPLNYKGLIFKIKYLQIKRCLESIIENFDKLQPSFEEGLLKEWFGIRFFKLDPLTLNIDRENRLKNLEEKIKALEVEIKALKKIFNQEKIKKNSIEKQISELKKINEESALFLKRKTLSDEKNETLVKISGILKELQELTPKLEKTEDITTDLKKQITLLEVDIDKSNSLLKNLSNKQINLSNKIITLKKEKQDFEKNSLKIITRIAKPRDLAFLNGYINELNAKIEKIGIPDRVKIKQYHSKIDAYQITKQNLTKADEDLNKKIVNVKKYQEEFKEFIERSLKDLKKHFSRILKRINYNGDLKRKSYRFEGKRRKILKEIEETPETILDDETFYGIDIKFKKPRDKRLVNFFDTNGKVLKRHSGGQKSLITLAYLLAIQALMKRTTSFYVLDEPTPQLDDVNTAHILKLFGETNVQIILFTPKPLPPEYFDEIISIFDEGITKIPKNALELIKSSEDSELDNYIMIRKNGD